MPRPRSHNIKVWCTQDEKKQIVNNAILYGLTTSMFLRKIGLNEPIKIPVDYEAIKPLLRLHGDIGRVAGLLKLWLVTNGGRGAPPSSITEVMEEFRCLQKELSEKITLL